jgi:hypothetical protein
MISVGTERPAFRHKPFFVLWKCCHGNFNAANAKKNICAPHWWTIAPNPYRRKMNSADLENGGFSMPQQIGPFLSIREARPDF